MMYVHAVATMLTLARDLPAVADRTTTIVVAFTIRAAKSQGTVVSQVPRSG